MNENEDDGSDSGEPTPEAESQTMTLVQRADAADWISVESSNLVAIAYTRFVTPGFSWFQRFLFVEFRKSRYVYREVPRQVFDALREAGSKGKYHAAYIKWVYPYERID